MKIITETERLILRELEESDAQYIFELDSDLEVLKYLSNDNLVNNIQESLEKIKRVRNQYLITGMGRWAVIEKSTNNFLGWSGIKLEGPKKHHPYQYYDIGYRFLKKYWGKGFATESSKASLKYGFNNLSLKEIYADVDDNNIESKKVLEKLGLKFIKFFDDDGYKCRWYKISNTDIYT